MSDSSIHLLPEVLQNDDGDMYFALGHVEPAMFALAVVVDMAANVGDCEALDTLTGGPRTPEAVTGFLGDVKHTWWRETDPSDDEKMDRCEPDVPGAQAFTELRL